MFNIIQLISDLMTSLHTEEIVLFSFDEEAIERFINDVKIIAPKCEINIAYDGCYSITVRHISIKEKQAIESHVSNSPILRW